MYCNIANNVFEAVVHGEVLFWRPWHSAEVARRSEDDPGRRYTLAYIYIYIYGMLIFISISIFIYIELHLRKRHMHLQIKICRYVYTYLHPCVHTHIYVYIDAHTHMFIHTYVHTCIDVHVCWDAFLNQGSLRVLRAQAETGSCSLICRACGRS